MEVAIASIQVPSGHRRTNSGKVKALADSIREIGQMQPIGLTEDNILIFGRHRLEACVSLGRTTIRAEVFKLDALKVEMAEIDENLQRYNLTAVQEAKALARRKEIYEALHPETKRGTAGGKASGESRRRLKDGTWSDGTTDKSSVVQSFADDTAARTDTTPRNVRRKVELGQKITDAAAVQLHGTKVADNKSELKKLAELDEDAQLEAAKKIGSGKAKTVDEATGAKKPKTPKKTACITEVKKVVRTWLKEQPDKGAAKAMIAALLRDFADSLTE